MLSFHPTRSSTGISDDNRPFSYSKKESGSNDISLHLVEFSNVHNTDRSSHATQWYPRVRMFVISLDPDSFVE